MHRWSSERLLETYAARSNELAREVHNDPGRRRHVEVRLHANTERLGRRVRRALGVRSTEDAVDAARRLYALIGIELHGVDASQILVHHCAFSSRYSFEVCRVMASADAGLFAGLTAGAELTFTERITSGAPACLATLTMGGER
jgi:predicted ArsR family transcriptional regulator